MLAYLVEIMPFQKLSIPGSQSSSLQARLDLPEAASPKAYALFAHCFTCNKNYKAISNISRALIRANIAVLRFDFTGLGESDGDFADTNFSSNVADLIAVADFLGAEFETPKLLIGHSLGGAAVLQAAAKINATRAVVTINAPCDPAYVVRHLGQAPDIIAEQGEAEIFLAGRPFTITKQFLDDLDQTRMRITIRQMGKPLLIFHAPDDDTVGIDNATHIFQAAQHPKSFIALDQADHLLTHSRDSTYVGTLIAAWARPYLEET